MKNILLLSLMLLQAIYSFSQSVAVNTDGTTADTSAMLEIKSTIKGILIPRMSTVEKNAIVTPATGLLVFDNDALSFWFFNGINWIELGGGGAMGSWALNGADIYNTNGGNVGIGTLSPLSKLTLLTDINTAGWMHVGQFNGVDSIVVSEGIGGVSASLGTSSQHAFRINAGGMGRLHLYPAGEVVVGSNATGSFGKFTVETLNNSYGISQLGEGGNILSTRIGGSSAGIGTFSNTHMRLFCNGRSDVFIAAATGNVGIGTENFDTYKLAVNGSIRAKEIRVNTGWADYVFNKKYKLRSLSEVEKFIKTHKRLPDIPSASTLKKEGVDISQMQTKMMAKIEELTLYMIEANKTIETLKQRLTSLEKSNN